MLVRGSVALALRFGVSVLAVGLTVVSFGTSAPELAVSISAALRGANDIAIGNVVGSNIANIALILGAITVMRPSVIHSKLLRIDIPLVIAVSLGLMLMLYDGQLALYEGVVFLIGLAIFIYVSFTHAKRRPDQYYLDVVTPPDVQKTKSLAPFFMIVGGCLVLTVGGQILVVAAIDIALSASISQATIALTVIAVGTSLPEFAASLVAAARGHSDLAVGNIVGSNIFNILGILGLTSTLTPLTRGGISWPVLWYMTALAVFLYVLLKPNKTLSRLKGGALLLSYFVYIVYLAE